MLIMMGANLIRFLLDVDGARSFAHELIDCCVRIRFLLGAGACHQACHFLSVQLMFECRCWFLSIIVI